ncbi:hypothetical protein COL154_013936 [Colletotrichum chrysophilum]|nr:hypothetical protein COL154_013936 [Colletotrichum chrysophilum]
MAKDFRVHAGTIIGNRQQNMVAFLCGTQHDMTLPRFTGSLTDIRHFNTMIDSVTDQMHQWIS